MPAESQLDRAFCAAIRQRRKALGLTQTEVAERLGMTQHRYSQIENGRSSPSLGLVARVADVLSIPVMIGEPAEAR